MGTGMLASGEKIPLQLVLFDGDTSKFVECTVTDSDGAAVTGSPFTIPHIADGVYSLPDTASMPDKPSVLATFIIYDDALFTAVSELHGQGIDIFLRDDVQLLIDDIELKLDALLLKGVVLGSSLEGFVLEQETLQAEISSSQITGEILEAETIEGAVVDSESLEGCILTEGTIEGET